MQQPLDRSKIFGRGTAALILTKDDLPQLLQIIGKRLIKIGPIRLIRVLGLKSPDTTKLRYPHLAFAPLIVLFCPYVLTAHWASILHNILERRSEIADLFPCHA